MPENASAEDQENPERQWALLTIFYAERNHSYDPEQSDDRNRAALQSAIANTEWKGAGRERKQNGKV